MVDFKADSVLPGAEVVLIQPRLYGRKQDLNLHIQFNNSGNERIHVSFRCVEGVEWISDHQYMYIDKLYNLSSLKDGEYDLRLNAGQQLIKKKVLIVTDLRSTRHIIF